MSFLLPTVGSYEQNHFIGIQAFGIAFLALAEMEGFVWLANPFYWSVVALLLRGSESVQTLMLSTIAVLIALSFLVHSPVTISEILVGYYVWLVSLSLALLASAGAIWHAKSQNDGNQRCQRH
ncbi:hypothetical protein NB063_14845 [Rhodopirellula sp. ICT_H3.1]|uniref:Uncharacterized protein n=1 Tax=Aporhodopirellula aestuarii TaxID=2950107 RepID=A0ABT0U4N3_9BACT|nr:hypothetical protein [Aporhodopirellula aestuarii]